MAWGSIEFAFKQIQYSPNSSSDESEPDLEPQPDPKESEVPLPEPEVEVEAEPEIIPDLEPLPPMPLFDFEEFQNPLLEDFFLPEIITDLGYESGNEGF